MENPEHPEGTKTANPKANRANPTVVLKADLPKLRHRIALSEENDHIVLDISDETGGLGLRLFLTPVLADQIGTRLCDRARHLVACASDDPKREGSEEFKL